MIKSVKYAVLLMFMACWATPTLATDQGGASSADDINSIIRSLSPDNDPVRPTQPTSTSPPPAPNPNAIWIAIPGSEPPMRVQVDYSRSIAMRLIFEKNSTELTRASIRKLERLARALDSPALARSKYLLTGHTDSSGSFDYNLRLSDRRARAVRRYLVRELGIERSRLHSVGMGEKPWNGVPVTRGPEHRVVRIGLIVDIALGR